MTVKRIFIFSAVVLGILIAWNLEQKPLIHAPGVLISEKPVQRDIRPTSFRFEDYWVTRKARFKIRARVLSSKPYYLHRESDLSPLDLALGWGVMSDQAVLDQIDISQRGRWYHTRYKLPAPISDQQIISNSSNMHMIPSRSEIGRSLKDLRIGDVIELNGYLVDVDHDSGWFWRTSMSRTDTGNGACEIVYVESVTVQQSS